MSDHHRIDAVMNCRWPAQKETTKLPALVCLSVIALFCAANGRTFQFSDSAAHYYEGLLIARGGRPFLDFVENKNPGIYYLSALAAMLGGWQMTWGVILFRLLDLLALFGIWKLIGIFSSYSSVRWLVFLSASVAYAGMFETGLETFYVESQEICFAALAYYLYLLGRMPFKVGAVVGFSLLFRQTAIVDLLAIGSHMIVAGHLGGKAPRATAKSLLLLVAGAAIPCLCMIVIAHNQGWLPLWWKYAYSWNMQYKAMAAPGFVRPLYLLERIFLTTPLIPLSILMLVWFWSLARGRTAGIPETGPLVSPPANAVLSSHGSCQWFLCAVFILHFLETSGAGEIHRHHVLTMIPALAMAGAFALDLLKKRGEKTLRDCVYPITASLCLSVAVIAALAYDLKAFGVMSGRWTYLEREGERMRFLGKWIQDNSSPSDSILAWGWKPELYLAAERHSASSFVHFFILTNWVERFEPLDGESLQRFDQDLRRNRPKFIFLFHTLDLGRYSAFAASAYTPEVLEMPAGDRVHLLRLSR